MRATYLPFHLPAIGDEEIRAVTDVLRSGWLTTGARVKEFEAAFAQFIGVRHAIALNSCTAALHLALEAAGVGPGDEVIVPTITFTATAEVVVHLGARPVLVDCQPDTLNIEPAAIESVVTPRTKAVVPVHLGGLPCDMPRIQAVARQHKLTVIEDAAHALPAAHAGSRVGTLGDVACFSFYATKTITTGEGGMVTTDVDAYADRIRMMSLHGISRDGWTRYTASGSWCYDILEAGFKCNLTDLAAAIGVEQLKKCHHFHDQRRRIADLYDEGFADLPEIQRPARYPDAEHAWHLYVIQLNLERLRIGRAEFIDALKRLNIGCSVHFIPLHQHSYYRRAFGYTAADFPNAAAAYDRIVSLPIFPGMETGDVTDVIDAVNTTVAQHRR
jgi:dTDP-4-amino-4,6-dideoxygalactose transaminase